MTTLLPRDNSVSLKLVITFSLFVTRLYGISMLAHNICRKVCSNWLISKSIFPHGPVLWKPLRLASKYSSVVSPNGTNHKETGVPSKEREAINETLSLISLHSFPSAVDSSNHPRLGVKFPRKAFKNLIAAQPSFSTYLSRLSPQGPLPLALCLNLVQFLRSSASLYLRFPTLQFILICRVHFIKQCLIS